MGRRVNGSGAGGHGRRNFSRPEIIWLDQEKNRETGEDILEYAGLKVEVDFVLRVEEQLLDYYAREISKSLHADKIEQAIEKMRCGVILARESRTLTPAMLCAWLYGLDLETMGEPVFEEIVKVACWAREMLDVETLQMLMLMAVLLNDDRCNDEAFMAYDTIRRLYEKATEEKSDMEDDRLSA